MTTTTRWATRIRGIVTSTIALAMGNVALAQQPQDRFQPLSQQAQEGISASPLLLAAYGFAWAAVFIYVFLLWRRLGKVEHELADVNAQLAKRARR
jgi:CcmD family protein